MSDDARDPLDDRLAELLADYDDRLAAGVEDVSADWADAVDAGALPELERLVAFLGLLERAWPRTGDASEQRADAGPTRPVPPEEVEPSPPSQEARPDHFGRFQVQQTLGQGGFGIVFLAWDSTLRRQVALKVPQPEMLAIPESRKRFLREAHAAACLDHPNIVPVYESGHVGRVGYIASAYCPGPTLAEWLARQPCPAPVRDLAGVVAVLARAVAHAHERGVLHRDLKPSNVILQHRNPSTPVAEEGDALAEFQPRITDFSLAWMAEGEGPGTQSGVPIGSPPYMAPEQAEGRLEAIGPATDVYGLGCILYELLIGHPPFRGTSQLDTLRQVIAEEPAAPRTGRPDVPAPLDAIVLKCLQKTPSERYSTAGELADDLERFLAGKPTHAHPPTRYERIRRQARRHAAALSLLAAGMGIAGALTVVWLLASARLARTQELARRREQEARAGDLAARRAGYVADVRLAKQFLGERHALRAIERLERHEPRPDDVDLRGFAWHYLMRRADTSRRTLRGFAGAVYSVEFSPRGDLLAAASMDGSVRIWKTRSWELQRVLRVGPTEVNAASFAPDGHRLATVGDDGMLRLWDVATGRCLATRHAHRGDGVVARFTRDGKFVITGGRNDGQLKLWACGGSELIETASVRVHTQEFEGAAISPDGVSVVTGGRTEVKLWRVGDLDPLAVFGPSALDMVQGVAFSHDGKLLATADEATTAVTLWDMSTRRPLRTLQGPTHGVYCVAFSADDRSIISGGGDRNIWLWDAATGKPRGLHQGHRGKLWSVAVSPDGRTIASASADGTVKLWDPEPSRDHLAIGLENYPAALRFSADAHVLATLEKNGTFSLWDARDGSLLQRQVIGGHGDSRHAGFAAAAGDISNDLRTLVFADGEGVVQLWDVDRRRARAAVSGPVGAVLTLGITPDGQAACVVRRERIEYWDLNTGQLRNSLTGPFGYPVAIADSRRVFVADLARHAVLVWNPLRGTTWEPDGVLYRPRCASVSQDGRFLIFQNVYEGQPRQSYVHIYSTESWRQVTPPLEASDEVTVLGLEPGGKTLVGGCPNGQIRTWDFASGEELFTLGAHPRQVNSLRFSPDGSALATASDRPGDGTEVFVWRAPPAGRAEGDVKP